MSSLNVDTEETLLHTKTYLESITDLISYSNDKIKEEHQALYKEVYFKINGVNTSGRLF